MSAVRVIVTRPARDAWHWVRQLQQAGVEAEALPLIEIAPALATADVQAIRQAWQTLDSYAACLFVSGNAVSYFFKKNNAVAHYPRAQSAIANIATKVPGLIPPGLRFMAPGPGTVAALVAAGVPAGQIDAPVLDARQFDSQALWQVIGQRDWRGRRVLVVRGESAGAATDTAKDNAGVPPVRDWIARQWTAAGAQLDFVAVYQRRAPRLTDAQIQRARLARNDGSVWLFSSSEAVANLVSLPVLAAIDWRGARAIATHPRIGDAVRAAGWGVVVASRPALKDIRNTLASIESSYP